MYDMYFIIHNIMPDNISFNQILFLNVSKNFTDSKLC